MALITMWEPLLFNTSNNHYFQGSIGINTTYLVLLVVSPTVPAFSETTISAFTSQELTAVAGTSYSTRVSMSPQPSYTLLSPSDTASSAVHAPLIASITTTTGSITAGGYAVVAATAATLGAAPVAYRPLFWNVTPISISTNSQRTFLVDLSAQVAQIVS